MNFLVHIGVNKTGTSSLQRSFRDRSAALSAQGILYPATGTQMSAHHPISRLIKGVKPASQGMTEDWEDRLRAEFGDHELCVLSSENFATVADPAPLARICPPGQTRIVIYLRDYARYMVSWYQQAIHSRNIAMSLQDFIAGHRADFAGTIANWARVYGRENVIVRLYDRDSLKNQDIVADFCALIRPGLERVFEGVSHDSNPSLSGNLLFFKRLLNPFITHAESLEIASEISGLCNLDPTFRGKLEVDVETVARIRALTRSDGAAIKAQTGLSLEPRQRMIAGSPSPALDRLEQDLDKIIQVAQSRDFRMMEYVGRMQGMSALFRQAHPA